MRTTDAPTTFGRLVDECAGALSYAKKKKKVPEHTIHAQRQKMFDTLMIAVLRMGHEPPIADELPIDLVYARKVRRRIERLL